MNKFRFHALLLVAALTGCANVPMPQFVAPTYTAPVATAAARPQAAPTRAAEVTTEVTRAVIAPQAIAPVGQAPSAQMVALSGSVAATAPTPEPRHMASAKGVYYDTKEVCLAHLTARTGKYYLPTSHHKLFGNKKRLSGLERRPLETDYCLKMDTPKGVKFVIVEAGVEVFAKVSASGIEIKLLAECQNTIYGAWTPEVETPRLAEVPASPAPQATCTTDGCGNTTVTKEITEITNVTQKCVVNGAQVPLVNGVCNAPQVTVKTPTSLVAPVSTPCGNCGSPQVGQAVTTPQLTLTGLTPRADGRCVLKVKDERGQEAFIRFGLQDGGHLTAVRVTDALGGTLIRQYATVVGYDDGGVKASAKLTTMDCGKAVEAFSDQRALRFVAPRLGFKWCIPVARV